jgi:hypothetical protein
MLDLKALNFKQLLFIFEYSHWCVEIITQHSSRLKIWLCKTSPTILSNRPATTHTHSHYNKIYKESRAAGVHSLRNKNVSVSVCGRCNPTEKSLKFWSEF